MLQGAFGFLGSIVALIVTAIAAAAFLTFLIVAWKSGALPGMIAWITGLIDLAREGVGGFFGFLRELIVFAGK